MLGAITFVLYLSTNKDLTLQSSSKQQVEESLDELLRYTDDSDLKNDGFLVLALKQHGVMKTLRPPLLQVLASAYGWFVEHIDQDDVAPQTTRNSVSEQNLKVAFGEFLESITRPDNLLWRNDQETS